MGPSIMGLPETSPVITMLYEAYRVAVAPGPTVIELESVPPPQ